jgi:ATP-dependent RNA helicase RhlE
VLPAGERLRGLVLCPTRELAMQVARDAEVLLAGTRHAVVTAYGKVSIRPQLEAIRAGCDLLVGTPGRVRELVDEEGVSLVHVRQVAVDEVDRMLDMGFQPQVRWLLERLPASRRTSLFTATLPEAAAELARRFLDDPVTVEAGRHSHADEHVREMLVEVENHDKVRMLLHLFERGHGRGTLVFCGTRRRVGWVGTALERNGVRAGQLHGDRSQRRREAALAAFTAGELDVLVCTDVAARGLHVERVRTVVNYDVPNDPEEYVHRVGRAGHGGDFGEAITLLCRRDAEKWERIAWSVTDPLPSTEIEGFEPSEDPRRAGRRGGRGGGGGHGEAPEPVAGRHEDRGGGGGGRGRGRGGRRPQPKEASRPGRTRSRNARKPIAPDEKPGGGVRRPRPAGE